MKDIKLDTPYKKIQWVISWIFFIIAGFLIIWLIAIGLNTYGKDTTDNKKKKKNVLNLSYQKLIYWYGAIASWIFVLGIIFSLF